MSSGYTSDNSISVNSEIISLTGCEVVGWSSVSASSDSAIDSGSSYLALTSPDRTSQDASNSEPRRFFEEFSTNDSEDCENLIDLMTPNLHSKNRTYDPTETPQVPPKSLETALEVYCAVKTPLSTVKFSKPLRECASPLRVVNSVLPDLESPSSDPAQIPRKLSRKRSTINLDSDVWPVSRPAVKIKKLESTTSASSIHFTDRPQHFHCNKSFSDLEFSQVTGNEENAFRKKSIEKNVDENSPMLKQLPIGGISARRCLTESVKSSRSSADQFSYSPDNYLSYQLFDYSPILPLLDPEDHNRGIHSAKWLSVETVAKLLNGGFQEELPHFQIIDCRWPYEYEGGHIRGAINYWSLLDAREQLFQPPLHAKKLGVHHSQTESSPGACKSVALIFHCEMSSKRAPEMANFVKKTDMCINLRRNQAGRESIATFYPQLYVMANGYRLFFERFPELCEPRNYVREQSRLDDSQKFFSRLRRERQFLRKELF